MASSWSCFVFSFFSSFVRLLWLVRAAWNSLAESDWFSISSGLISFLSCIVSCSAIQASSDCWVCSSRLILLTHCFFLDSFCPDRRSCRNGVVQGVPGLVILMRSASLWLGRAEIWYSVSSKASFMFFVGISCVILVSSQPPFGFLICIFVVVCSVLWVCFVLLLVVLGVVFFVRSRFFGDLIGEAARV